MMNIDGVPLTKGGRAVIYQGADGKTYARIDPVGDPRECTANHTTEVPQRFPLWWLSFCDANMPEGLRFTGVSIVEAPTFQMAVSMSHMLGCNPGGEVEGIQLPDSVRQLHEKHLNRLMRRTELEEHFGPLVRLR